jgi:hypothetical protein
MVNATTSNGFLQVFASKFDSEHAGIVLVNRNAAPRYVKIDINNFQTGNRLYWYNFEGEVSDGSFSRKVFINGEGPSQIAGGPDNYNDIPSYSYEIEDSIMIESPPFSVQFIVIEGNTYVSVDNQSLASTNIENFRLEQNFPNPFNPETHIKYQLSENSKVTLDVFDILGRRINTLISENVSPGSHKITWNGRNDADAKVSSGVYLYRINVVNSQGSFIETRKMTLLK